MSALTTVPATREHAVNMDRLYSNDVSAALTAPQTPTVASCTMYDVTATVSVALTDTAVVAGNVVSQRVRANTLTAGHIYRLVFIFTPSGTTDIVDSVLGLVCPF